MLYGTLIRTLRRRCGLTQRQLGEHCGLTASAIGMIEQGRRLPGRRADERLRQFFARYGGCPAAGLTSGCGSFLPGTAAACRCGPASLSGAPNCWSCCGTNSGLPLLWQPGEARRAFRPSAGTCERSSQRPPQAAGPAGRSPHALGRRRAAQNRFGILSCKKPRRSRSGGACFAFGRGPRAKSHRLTVQMLISRATL